MRNHYSAALLLVLPSMVAMVPAFVTSGRTIEITVSRSAISPEQIDLHVGERVRLNVVSADGAHAFQVKGLRVDARIPAGGETVTLDIMPTEPGTFEIEGADVSPGDGGMKARLIVTR
jgi:heme/copper-type cytochrome/quinol oxidase subunit 2